MHKTIKLKLEEGSSVRCANCDTKLYDGETAVDLGPDGIACSIPCAEEVS